VFGREVVDLEEVEGLPGALADLLLLCDDLAPEPGVTDRIADSPICPFGASIRFSSTVISDNSRAIWKVRTSPFRAIRYGSSPVTSSPLK